MAVKNVWAYGGLNGTSYPPQGYLAFDEYPQEYGKFENWEDATPTTYVTLAFYSGEEKIWESDYYSIPEGSGMSINKTLSIPALSNVTSMGMEFYDGSHNPIYDGWVIEPSTPYFLFPETVNINATPNTLFRYFVNDFDGSSYLDVEWADDSTGAKFIVALDIADPTPPATNPANPALMMGGY
jgi:hypothetical protein